MRVNLVREKKYSISWPEDKPPEEQLTLHMQLMTHRQRNEIEDSMTKVAISPGKKAIDHWSCPTGTISSKKLGMAVKGWEGVEDEEGNPIKYTFESLQDLILLNAGMPRVKDKTLDDFVMDDINKKNGFDNEENEEDEDNGGAEGNDGSEED